MAFYDFKAIKAAVSIENAMVYLSLKGMTVEEGSYRGTCPACKSGGSRALVISPEKQSFYCFTAKKGGDCISLVAHIHGTSMKEAAGFLEDKMAKKKPEAPTPTEGFKPLEHLHYDHDAVTAMGLPHYVAEALGIGFASKGLMRGHISVPLRTAQGNLVGYLGIPQGTQVKLPDQFHGITDKVVPITKHKRRA